MAFGVLQTINHHKPHCHRNRKLLHWKVIYLQTLHGYLRPRISGRGPPIRNNSWRNRRFFWSNAPGPQGLVDCFGPGMYIPHESSCRTYLLRLGSVLGCLLQVDGWGWNSHVLHFPIGLSQSGRNEQEVQDVSNVSTSHQSRGVVSCIRQQQSYNQHVMWLLQTKKTSTISNNLKDATQYLKNSSRGTAPWDPRTGRGCLRKRWPVVLGVAL